ncbi:hypothetical protein [Methanomethylophilus alvi]|uniref:hypothetical protein n=1 Tax=Methanomethylophilus alvi TaxID=1291540 RepID=UPI0037DD5384
MVAFNMKSIAVLTAALMVCSISAVALADNDDSSADAGKGYEFYIQLNDGTNSYSSWLGVHSGDSFGTALKDAFDKAGFIYSMSGNWISSITVDGVEYSSGEWGTDPYYGYAIYYSDGVKWVPTEEYNEGSMFAIVFDKYLFSAPENPDIYYNNYNYYYSLLPSVPVCSEWCFNLQLNNGTDSINTWIPSQDAKELTSEAFAAALKSALDARGFTYDITETGWVKSITANGVEYKVAARSILIRTTDSPSITPRARNGFRPTTTPRAPCSPSCSTSTSSPLPQRPTNITTGDGATIPSSRPQPPAHTHPLSWSLPMTWTACSSMSPPPYLRCSPSG